MGSFFLNPGLVLAGGALIASPIIIHIINRLRFRRVRFAAMEFLLQSQKKNRRRILIEQLLLLLLRILIVLGLMFLIARMILSPSQLAELKGEASSHHVILIDDSGSMQEIVNVKSAFDQAKDIALTMVEEKGVKAKGRQEFSIFFLSKLLNNQQDAALESREADDKFLGELKDALTAADCTFRELDLEAGIKLAGERLQSGKSAASQIKFLHVISDYRSDDWEGDTSIVKTVEALTNPGGDDKSQAMQRISLNFIRSVKTAQPNVAITALTADVETAAVDVPIPVTVKIKNFGRTVVENLTVGVYTDGTLRLQAVPFDKIEPGKEETRTTYVAFTAPGSHRIELRLPKRKADALQADNSRFVAVEYLPPVNRVLVVDADRSRTDSLFIQDALSADKSLSGIQVDLQDPDFIEKNSLQPYQCVFVVNTPQLSVKAVRTLEKYVRDGGGLAWFLGRLGDRSNERTIGPTAYNTEIYKLKLKSVDDKGKPSFIVDGLFPAPLEPLSRDVIKTDANSKAKDLKLATGHPVLEYLADELFFPELSRVKRYWPTSSKIPVSRFNNQDGADKVKDYFWSKDDNNRKDGVKTLATLRDGSPILFEHSLGRGRVVTCLTSAGRDWTNWPTVSPYFVLMIQIRNWIAVRKFDRQRHVGTPIAEILPKSVFEKRAKISSPEYGKQEFNLDAEDVAPGKVEPKAETDAKTAKTPADPATKKTEDSAPKMQVYRFPSTDKPGIYTLSLRRHTKSAITGSNEENRMFAYNVPTKESSTALFSKDDLEQKFSDNEHVRVYDYDDDQIVAGQEPGREVRVILLFILIGLLIAEQLLAYRLSYHTRET